MEISLDALLGARRVLADRLAQGVSGLLLHAHLQPPQLPPLPIRLIPFDIELPHKLLPFDIELPPVPFVGADLPAAVAEIGGRLGQAGSGIGGAVQQLSRQLPLPFRARHRTWDAVPPPPPAAASRGPGAEAGLAFEGGDEIDSLQAAAAAAAAATGGAAAASENGDADESDDEEEEEVGFQIGTFGRFQRPKGRINVSAKYDTRNQTVDGSVVAHGEIWRLESSRGGSSYGNNSRPPFLIQLGPIIFVQDSTLLFPINLSKQHLVWYGFDRKSGVHSICPAIWSKQKSWLLMSMMCLNPISCAFMDVQFPNGQLKYVAGEGLTGSGFLPLFGGVLQVLGKRPGETKLSFSFKSTRGTRFTPAFQWPDNSVSFGVAQTVAWKKTGVLVKPSIQVSVCPTFGGSDPGIQAEVVHSLKEEVSVMYGLSCSRHPSAFTSLSLGRSKMNGEVCSSGVVITMEAPLDNMGRPSLSVQLNGGFQF